MTRVSPWITEQTLRYSGGSHRTASPRMATHVSSKTDMPSLARCEMWVISASRDERWSKPRSVLKDKSLSINSNSVTSLLNLQVWCRAAVLEYQILTVWWPELVARSWSSRENLKDKPVSQWPSKVWIKVLVTTSHSFIVLSLDPETRNRPSGENVTQWTELEWLLRVCSREPVVISHTLTVSSLEPEAKSRLSGAKITQYIGSRWPTSVKYAPVAVSQIFIHSSW